MSEPLLCVVIPNWNGKALLGACLDSLKLQSQPAEVIVVDNGSGDGSVDFLKKKYPNVGLVILDKNYGFAGGVNRGIKSALDRGAEFVALLNNDAVVDPKWLKALLATARTLPKTGIVTGKLVRIDREHLDSTGDFYTIWGLPFPRGRNELDRGQYDQEEAVFGASGGASLYRSSMLKEIGLFDEAFFAYFEDVDLSFRAQLAGWEVRYQPKAIAYHHVNATARRLGSFARYHSVKNFALLYTKNMPGRLYWQYLPLATIQFVRLGASSLVRGQFPAFLKGCAGALHYLPQSLSARHKIQKSRRVPISYINSILVHHRPPKPTPFPEKI